MAYTTWVQSPLSVSFWSINASPAKRPRRTFYTAEDVLELLEEDETGNEGMSSDELSNIK